MSVESAGFPYPDEETPRISVIAPIAFENGSEPTDLLAGSNAAFIAGAGVSLDDISPAWSGESAHSE